MVSVLAWRVAPVRIALVALCLVGWGISPRAIADELEKTEQPTGAIVGKVTDSQGNAVPEAQVSIYRYETGGRFGRWDRLGEQTTADKQGAFRFGALRDGYYRLGIAKSGFARVFVDRSVEDHGEARAEVVLQPPVTVTIELTDDAGQPVVGARIRQIRGNGANGDSALTQNDLRHLQIQIPPSDAQGHLRLSGIPSGEILKLTIDHPRLAPIWIENLKAENGLVIKATMKPGVVLTLRQSATDAASRVDRAEFDLRRNERLHPSEFAFYEVEFDSTGTAQLAIEAGTYSFLRLEHPDFFLTPTYMSDRGAKNSLQIDTGKNNTLTFELHRRIVARGRVVHAETGEPVAGVDLLGDISCSFPDGDRSRQVWNFTGWGETDAKGYYTVPVAAGKCRVTFHGDKLIAESNSVEFTATADGTTEIPEVRVRPIPKIVGRVQHPDGRPAARAVVRLRGGIISNLQPVLTDDEGRFELQPEFIPRDSETEESQFSQQLVAFDPHSALAARVPVQLNQSEEAQLTLEPHATDWLFTAFSADLTDWERGQVEPQRAANDRAKSLHGRPAPELDGAGWINSEPLLLERLRGKYVLLNFWYTGCGPCHYEFPSVKLAHELFKDQGVVVIAFHNNSAPLEAVREHALKRGLTFPIFVDHPDGRTLARYEPHGIPESYPNFVLIGPDGNVLLDDRTIPHPTLRRYKLEILRQYVLASQAEKAAAAPPDAEGELLTGVVLANDGTPAAGATVTAAAIFRSPPLRFTTRTDGQGSFRLRLPKVDGHTRYSVAVQGTNQGAMLLEALDDQGKPAPIQGQPLPTMSIRLRPAGRLRGRLLQAEDGRPIAGGRLFLDTGEVLTTDGAGRFEHQGLLMRAHSLIPVAPGRVRRYVLFDTTLRPEAELDIALERGAIVRGRVTNEAGEPIPEAYVHRSSSGTALTLNGWDEQCRTDGSFEYGGLSPQRLFYGLNVRAPGYVSQSITVDVASAEETHERPVKLKKLPDSTPAESNDPPAAARVKPEPVAKLPRRTIEGTVVNAEGRPVSGARIRWGTFLWDPSVKPTTTNDAGRYRLTEVPEGAGAILAVGAGFAPQFVPARQGVSKVDVKLSRGLPARGVVRGLTGAPVSGVEIVPVISCPETGYCNPIWLSELATRTNDEGEFSLHAMPVTQVGFDFLKQGYSELRHVSLQTGEHLNEVQLSAGGAIAGRVVDPAGKPVRDFKITVTTPRTRQPNEKVGGFYAGFHWYGVDFTRDDGGFTLTDIDANAWMRFVVTSPGVGRAVLDRVQAESLDELLDPDRLVIHLAPFTPLAVRVVDAKSGNPIADARVGLLADELRSTGFFNWGHDDLWCTRARTDKHGEALFREPQGDDGTIIVSAPKYARSRLAWKTDQKELLVELEPEVRLHGEVLWRGQPLQEGWARLTGPDGDAVGVNLDETNGRVEFGQLREGEYGFAVAGSDGQIRFTRTLTLPEGTTTLPPIELDKSSD